MRDSNTIEMEMDIAQQTHRALLFARNRILRSMCCKCGCTDIKYNTRAKSDKNLYYVLSRVEAMPLIFYIDSSVIASLNRHLKLFLVCLNHLHLTVFCGYVIVIPSFIFLPNFLKSCTSAKKLKQGVCNLRNHLAKMHHFVLIKAVSLCCQQVFSQKAGFNSLLL